MAARPAPELSTDPSVMGFWYRNASIGRTHSARPRAARRRGSTDPHGSRRPRQNDQPERERRATAVRHTGAAYTCKIGAERALVQRDDEEADDQRLDLHRRERDQPANDATYVGQGALILSGTFNMDNHDKLCVKLAGGDCDTPATWNPNDSGMFVFATGDCCTSLQRQRNPASASRSRKANSREGSSPRTRSTRESPAP